MAKASGSMMQTTAKAPLTGIKRQLRSSIGERLLMLPNRENLSAATRIREDRTYHEAAGIVSVNQASLIAVGAKVLLVEVNEAAKRVNRATVVVQAARVCPRPQGRAVVPEVVAAEEEEEAVAAVDAPAAVGAVAEVAVAADAGN